MNDAVGRGESEMLAISGAIVVKLVLEINKEWEPDPIKAHHQKREQHAKPKQLGLPDVFLLDAYLQSIQLSARIHAQHADAAVFTFQPHDILQIHTRADVIRDHSDTLSETRFLVTVADIDLTVFLT